MLRKEIDGVNRDLTRLLLRRIKLSSKIVQLKRDLGLPMEDLFREQEMLRRATRGIRARKEAKAARAHLTFCISLTKKLNR